MKFLIVSDREYRKTSRGIDIITAYLSDKGHSIDHLVFFTRKKLQDKQVSENIKQLYIYDFIKLFYIKLQFLLPSFIITSYFNHIIKKSGINFKQYDYVILESGKPLFLASVIDNKIIYRQSDPIFTALNSNRRFYKNLELNVIKRSVFISSALDKKYFIPDFKEKTFYWHSGFVPCKTDNVNININKSFIILGGKIDWPLIIKFANKYKDYKFNIIGFYNKIPIQKNIIINGYLEYKDYQNILLSSSAAIIPFTKRYTYKLKQISFTAKLLVSMHLGLPILVRAYSDIQESDINKKLSVYKNHKEALSLFDSIVKKLESGKLTRDVSKETTEFLEPQIMENRLKELDVLFSKWIN